MLASIVQESVGECEVVHTDPAAIPYRLRQVLPPMRTAGRRSAILIATFVPKLRARRLATKAIFYRRARTRGAVKQLLRAEPVSALHDQSRTRKVMCSPLGHCLELPAYTGIRWAS